jgi:translation initiation factor 4G
MSKKEESKDKSSEPKLKLNLNAKEYIPKQSLLNSLGTSSYQQGQKHTPLSLSQSNYKSFIPKKNRPSEPIIEREYFIRYPNETLKKTKFDFEYMLSFEKWKISSEKKLLSKEFLNHLEKFKIFEEEQFKNSPSKRERNSGKRKYYKNENNKDEKKELEFKRNEINEDDMKQWGRKDLSKEIAIAEQFKQNFDEQRKKDPIRFDLRELLNILTVDNYNETANLIYDKIKDDLEYQSKFLDVLFIKAVNEQAFVSLYAKLCKEFDKKLPQRNEKAAGKKTTSKMRSKLLDQCREIFKIENNEKFDEYIKVDDPIEREIKLKKFVLGNVNFIGELINNVVLSKKIVFQCIENLFKRFENSMDVQLKLINLEAIVILMDKFGTLLKNSESKMKKEDLDNFNKKIEEYLEKLDIVQKEGKIPGYIKYKIINLIERKKDNWVESKFQKSIEAKSLDEVRKEAQEAQRIKNNNKDDDKYSQDEINDKIRIDLNHWKEFLEDGENKKENYDWEIIEDIYSIHKNTIANILSGFLENCIDFVQNKKTLGFANDYFKDLISFYKKIPKDEKFEVSDKAIHLIKVAKDYSLDNILIIDVWANIVFCLIKYEIMKYDAFNKLKDIGEEELKCVFTIFYKVGEYDKKIKNHFDKIKLVQDNISLYSSVEY